MLTKSFLLLLTGVNWFTPTSYIPSGKHLLRGYTMPGPRLSTGDRNKVDAAPAHLDHKTSGEASPKGN